VVTLTVEDKIVECFVAMVREQNVILDCSVHNPTHLVSEDPEYDVGCDQPRVLRSIRDTSVHVDSTFRPPHHSDDGRQQAALDSGIRRSTFVSFDGETTSY